MNKRLSIAVEAIMGAITMAFMMALSVVLISSNKIGYSVICSIVGCFGGLILLMKAIEAAGMSKDDSITGLAFPERKVKSYRSRKTFGR
jgi:hypothetical protein